MGKLPTCLCFSILSYKMGIRVVSTWSGEMTTQNVLTTVLWDVERSKYQRYYHELKFSSPCSDEAWPGDSWLSHGTPHSEKTLKSSGFLSCWGRGAHDLFEKMINVVDSLRGKVNESQISHMFFRGFQHNRTTELLGSTDPWLETSVLSPSCLWAYQDYPSIALYAVRMFIWCKN